MKHQAQPFLKWAGGKRQLLSEIESRLPEGLKDGSIKRYVEPFAGGGAVLFYVQSHYHPEECHIFDQNRELSLVYSVVQKDVERLIEHLKVSEEEYLALDESHRSEYFYSVRKRFNEAGEKTDFSSYTRDHAQRAADMIFLNRTCFNGLFRVNSGGGFNVPHGRYNKPHIMNEDVLRVDSLALRNTEIHHGDFSECRELTGKEAFFYFDPPYRPINRTSSFTNYSRYGFDDDDQRRLAELYRNLDASGASLMLSNSDPRNGDPEDDFFDDLYSGYSIDRVPARRLINSDASGRGAINELLITNYPF